MPKPTRVDPATLIDAAIDELMIIFRREMPAGLPDHRKRDWFKEMIAILADDGRADHGAALREVQLRYALLAKGGHGSPEGNRA